MSGNASYCPKCGASVVYEQRDAHRFSTDLGWPVVDSRAFCPNKRLPFDGHYRGRWKSRHIDPKYIPAGKTLAEAIIEADR